MMASDMPDSVGGSKSVDGDGEGEEEDDELLEGGHG